MEQEIQLNEHNKQEYPPMHTAEHILNQARHCALSASETMTLARVSEHMSITRQKSDISKCSHTITPTDGYACVSN